MKLCRKYSKFALVLFNEDLSQLLDVFSMVLGEFLSLLD